MKYFFRNTVSADNPGERESQQTDFFQLPIYLEGPVLSVMFSFSFFFF